MTNEQLETVRAARLSLIDHGDEIAAALLDWAVTAEPAQTLFLALHSSGEGYVSDERRDVEHAARTQRHNFTTVVADQFREVYEEGVTIFEIARPVKES